MSLRDRDNPIRDCNVTIGWLAVRERNAPTAQRWGVFYLDETDPDRACAWVGSSQADAEKAAHRVVARGVAAPRVYVDPNANGSPRQELHADDRKPARGGR